MGVFGKTFHQFNTHQAIDHQTFVFPNGVTVSGGNQTMNCNYQVGNVDVFVRGIKMAESEFTADDGTSVSIPVATLSMTAGDEITIIGRKYPTADIMNSGAVNISGGQVNNTTLSNATISGSSFAGTATISSGTLGSSVVVPASIGGNEVLLESHTFDNTIADKIINFNDFSTTYDQYKIRMVRVQPATDDKDFRIRISADGSTYLTSYRGVLNRSYYNGSTATSNAVGITSYFLAITSVGNADNDSTGVSNEGIDIDMIISYPLRSNTRTFLRAYYSHHTAGGNVHAAVGACRVLSSSTSHPYFKIYWESAVNFKSGEMYLYGIKNA